MCIGDYTYVTLCHFIMLHNIDISSMTIVISSLYLIYWTLSVYTHNYDMIWYIILYYLTHVMLSCYIISILVI